MESRTSPGKKGSVLPISGCPGVAFRLSLVLVSRPVGRGERDSFSSVLGGCVQPGQIARWEERISPHPRRRSFCPGCLVSLVARLPAVQLEIWSATFVVCGLP